jgi:hypothetical protein
MATSSFNKNFVINNKEAVIVLQKALKAAPKKYTPKRDILKVLEKGAKKLSRIS